MGLAWTRLWRVYKTGDIPTQDKQFFNTTSIHNQLQIIPVCINQEVGPSDDLAALILKSQEIHDGDILIVTQKVISKQEGRVVALSDVRTTFLSDGIGSQYGRDPRIVELVLSETKRIVRMRDGIIISETHSGLICANAGVDESNVRDGYAVLLPRDPDSSAQGIRTRIMSLTGCNVAVVISDTFGRPFRMGQTDCAIGVSGLNPILDYSGTFDSFGKILRVTAIAVADEISSAAELVMRKTLMCPVAIVRNHDIMVDCVSPDTQGARDAPKDAVCTGASALIRPEDKDLFR